MFATVRAGEILVAVGKIFQLRSNEAIVGQRYMMDVGARAFSGVGTWVLQ
jgi:hypothetical protein